MTDYDVESLHIRGVGYEWIEKRLAELGKNKAGLGRALGAPRQRITEITAGRRRVAVEEIPALANYLEMATFDVLQALVGQSYDTQAPYLGVSVVGAVQAGAWNENAQWEESFHYAVPVPPDPRYPNYSRYGLEVRGESMDLVYPEGSVVICVPIREIESEPDNGARVIVERRNFGGETEATVKELAIDPAGDKWLTAKSSNPAHSAPIPLSDGQTEAVEITGLVIGSYRPE